ncbi:serine/threonine-protein kinase [Streptomyces sannanensis]|uniref:non-specific serine/threonine protein kinase n=1 Tax=Streptomyces sannanensis TaxID=285536 RepID=A0ABP6SF22_9ACTN
MLAGRYRLAEAIGRGGMGKVWRAHDEVLHRIVAVKELTAGLYVSEADRSVMHARTQKEARAAARINHPGVVTVHDVLEHDGRPWIVMEYVDGPSLAEAAKASGRIESREAARIGLHVLGALRAAHAAGVVHRDVKPGNVLLAKDGRVLLTDFGIAAIEGDSSITRTGELVGSIDYLAPERVRGGAPRPASDLWSLGATLHSAVEGGGSPFRRTSPISTMQAVVQDEPPTCVHAGPLAPVITALLCKEPEERPSAAEAERMLLDAMEGREPRTAQAYVPTQRVPAETLHTVTARAAAPDPPVPSQGRTRSGPRVAAVVIVLAAAVGGAVGLAVLKYPDLKDPGGGDKGRSPVTEGPPTAGPATTSPSAGTPSGSPSEPAARTGWKRVQDPAGFSLLVPDGWKRRVEGDQIDYTPDDGAHRIRIAIDHSPDFETPHLHMLNVEKALAKRLPEYRRVSLGANHYRDLAASLWEFTWNEERDHPGRRHAIDQMYYSEDGRTEYAIYMSGPEKDWAKTREQFDTVLQGWQPRP